jgi:hypothetical protein
MNVSGLLIAFDLPFFETVANPKVRRRAAVPLPPNLNIKDCRQDDMKRFTRFALHPKSEIGFGC